MSEQESSSPKPLPAKPPKKRRILRGVTTVLVALAAVVALWSVAQVVIKRPRPAALFSNSDLPASTPVSENGWEILLNEWRSAGDPKRVEKELAEICDAKATIDDRWALAESRAQKISDAAHDASTTKWISLADKVLALPRFTDSCPIGVESDCPRGLHLLALHQYQEATVFHAAMGGQWDDAFARAAKVTRADVDFAPSSRSAITQAVSQANLRRSMKLVGALLDGVAKATSAGKGPDASKVGNFVQEVDTQLAKIRVEDMDPLRTVVAEYLYSLASLDVADKALRAKYGPIMSIVYDPGHTMEMLNAQFEQLTVYARAGGTGARPDFRRSSTWFLRNPLGQRLVEIVHPALVDRIPIIEKDRQAVIKERDELRARLTGLMKSQ